jgi:hypothetical protein
MNGYKRTSPLQPAQDDPSRSKLSALSGGYRGDLAPHLIPPDSSPNLEGIRFEQGAIRKDFGARRLGSAASSRVIGIGEHKFITDQKTFERLVRLTRTGTSNLQLEVLTAGEWQVIDTSVEEVNDVYLSLASIQGILMIADGDRLFRWSESIETEIREDDFPAGNSIGAMDDTVLATVGGVPANGNLKVAFSTTISGTSTDGITLKVGVERNGVEIDEKTFAAPASVDPLASESWDDQQSTYSISGLEDADEITLRIKSIEANNPNPVITLEDEASALTTKALAPAAISDLYNFNFDLDVSGPPGSSIIADLQFSTDGGGSWTSSGVAPEYPIGTYIGETFDITAVGMGAGDKFRVHRTAVGGLAIATFSNFTVTYEIPPEAPVTVEVHGSNKTVDLDPKAGLETDASIDNVSTLAVIAGAPAARMIFPFEDYGVALRDGGDTQTFSWTVSGNMLDWTGEGSGQLFLVAAQSDPIDDLMSFATLGSGIGALFRRRSIMRVFLTGNALQSLGVVRWIERLGTDAGFSVQAVLGGVMFLGSDFQVYLLTEQGPQTVGTPIHQDLIRSLTGNLDLVDSSYDEGFHTYVLGIPEAGASSITRLWYFDVMAFHTQQKLVWRTRGIEVQRLATVSKL